MATVDQLLNRRMGELSRRLHIDEFLLLIAAKVITELSEVKEIGYDYPLLDRIIGSTFVSSFSECRRLSAEYDLKRGRNVAEAAENLQVLEGFRFDEEEGLKELIKKAPEDGLVRRYHLYAIERYHNALSSFLNLHGNRFVSEFVLCHCAGDLRAIQDLWLMTETNFTEADKVTVLKSTFNEN